MALVSDRRDLLLTPQGWDITFENRDLAFVSGSNAVGQAIKFKLQLLEEEWFLDKDAGTPWLQEILAKKFNELFLRPLFFELVSSVEGVAQITRLEVTFDSATRQLSVAYTVTTVFGDTLGNAVSLGVPV